MESVPGAVAAGLLFGHLDLSVGDPVAIAPGTDLIIVIYPVSYSIFPDQDLKRQVDGWRPASGF